LNDSEEQVCVYDLELQKFVAKFHPASYSIYFEEGYSSFNLRKLSIWGIINDIFILKSSNEEF